MSLLSIDYLIVYAFLLTTLVIGLLAGSKVKDIREYAIGNKNFGTGALTITLLATYIGGWHLFGFPSDVFADGITHIIPELVCGVVICFLFIAWFIAPKMAYFEHCLTMGDLMKIFYGEYGQIVTGILGLVYNTTAISIQIIFLGHICNFLGIDSDWGLILAVLILAVYTANGGMKAVVITDILQFTAIVAAIPLLAHLMIYQVGGIKQLLSVVPQEKLQLFNFGQDKTGAFSASYYAFPILTLWMLFPGFPLSFPFIQRMLMAKHKSVNAYYTSIFFMISFFLLLALIGLAALALHPQINSQDVVTHVVNGLPVGLKGLVYAALLAVIMSTTDSFLHAAGVSLTHDLIKPLSEKTDVTINELKVAQYTTLLIACLSIAVALSVKDISKIAMYGMDLAALLFTIPMIAGIMGLKTEARSFYISASMTTIVFVFGQYYLNNELVLPIAIITNLLSFFGTHYFQHHGFAVVVRTPVQSKDYIWQPTRTRAYNGLLTRVLHAPQSLLHYSQNRLEKYGANPTLFALFISLGYMIPFFMHSYAVPIAYNWLLTIRGIGALLCVGLMLKSYWPKRLLHYFPSYYHFSLLYCLPFVTTFIFLLEGGSIEWLLNVALSIMLLIVLVDWVSFIWISIIGIVLALGVYKLGLGPLSVSISLDIETKYTLVYAVLFSTLIGLLFARRKQKSFDTLDSLRRRSTRESQETQEELFKATEEKFQVVELLKKAGIEELGHVAHLSKELLEISQQGGHKDQLASLAQQLNNKLTPMALQLDKFSHRATGFLLLEGVEKMAIDKFLQILQLHTENHKFKIVLRTRHKTMQCDADKMKKVLVNSRSFTQAVAGEDAVILLGIEDTQLGYPLDVKTGKHTKQVDALRFTITTAPDLPELEELYMSQMDEEIRVKPEVATDLPLLANERIVKAHYGYSSTISAGEDLNLVYVIPVNIREVRSKDMDVPEMKLGAEWPQADDTYPGAQKQEQALINDIKVRSKADLNLVKKAISVIKDYHGPVMRKSGEPFYLHPIAVAQIVLDYNPDEATVLGALLHDTVEDTPLTLEQIELLFNKEVRNIVSGVTHMESSKETNYKVLLSHPENIHRLLEAEDRRVLYVKLADRIHNMRTIEAKPYESQRRTAEETLFFFVPLSKYLGLTEAAEELKNMSFDILNRRFIQI